MHLQHIWPDPGYFLVDAEIQGQYAAERAAPVLLRGRSRRQVSLREVQEGHLGEENFLYAKVPQNPGAAPEEVQDLPRQAENHHNGEVSNQKPGHITVLMTLLSRPQLRFDLRLYLPNPPARQVVSLFLVSLFLFFRAGISERRWIESADSLDGLLSWFRGRRLWGQFH